MAYSDLMEETNVIRRRHNGIYSTRLGKGDKMIKGR
jgi:hypothetical protein